jgi:hypothetical protein
VVCFLGDDQLIISSCQSKVRVMRCGFAKIRKKNWMERVFLDGDFIAFGGGILGTRIGWMGHGFFGIGIFRNTDWMDGIRILSPSAFGF